MSLEVRQHLADDLVGDLGHVVVLASVPSALFEDSFRADVLEIDATLERMIWRSVARYSELSGRPVPVGQAAAYGMFDGLFQQALLRHLAGDPAAVDGLRTAVLDLLRPLFH